MVTHEQIHPQSVLYLLFYGGAAVTAVLLCLYLLFRKGNAIATDINPPMRLRRWAAAFFGITSASHLWWVLFFFFSNDSSSWVFVALTVLDYMSLLITLFGTQLSMLQDRRRPLSPFLAATIPIVVLGGLQIARPDASIMTPLIVYTLAVYTCFTIYMVVAVRQYSRWLRDNYADLEHKEVWLSHTLLFVILLLFVNYGFAADVPSSLVIRLTDFLIFGLLLWRVETLPSLMPSRLMEKSECSRDSKSTEELLRVPSAARGLVAEEVRECGAEEVRECADEYIGAAKDEGVRVAENDEFSKIGELLTEHCENTGLYLQHDLTLVQVSVAIGINRYYLSRYFSTQGTNYNAYINGLRINHFVSLYKEAVAAQRPFTIQQLAQESGYRSYSTFSLAFKQRMGQSVTAWKHDS